MTGSGRLSCRCIDSVADNYYLSTVAADAAVERRCWFLSVIGQELETLFCLCSALRDPRPLTHVLLRVARCFHSDRFLGTCGQPVSCRATFCAQQFSGFVLIGGRSQALRRAMQQVQLTLLSITALSTAPAECVYCILRTQRRFPLAHAASVIA